MPSADVKISPPTFTPVFDASNRWAAIRVNHAPDFQPGPGLLTLMEDVLWPATDDSVDNPADNPLAGLPLLIETINPGQWTQTFGNARRSCKLHFLVPALRLAEAEPQLMSAGIPLDNAVLMAYGSPVDVTPVRALGVDTAQGMNECKPALLKQLPGPHLAANIASHSIHRQCVDSGFHWFEGSWPLRAEGGPNAQGTTSRSTLLNLLGLVANDADTREIETLFKRDPNLSYQLLKLVNSVSFSLTQTITSFKQAITLLGRRQLQRWLQLLIYAGHHGSGGASALLSLVARRAALMEFAVAARGGKQDEQDRAFMTGMFSLLDVLFHAPIADLVLPLKLHDEVTAALVTHEGTLGRLLLLATETESTAPGGNLLQNLAALEISPDRFIRIQLQALAWAAQVSGEIG